MTHPFNIYIILQEKKRNKTVHDREKLDYFFFFSSFNNMLKIFAVLFMYVHGMNLKNSTVNFNIGYNVSKPLKIMIQSRYKRFKP